jgi:hypothetical protein
MILVPAGTEPIPLLPRKTPMKTEIVMMVQRTLSEDLSCPLRVWPECLIRERMISEPSQKKEIIGMKSERSTADSNCFHGRNAR